jgi:RNA polymerase sigma factor (sigma-70 family)
MINLVTSATSQPQRMYMDDGPEEFIPTRKSLLSRLKNWEDAKSWRDFFDTYWKLIYHAALKSGLTHGEAEDVVQETVLAVARNIGEFKYDPAICSFKAWLLKVTRSRIANQLNRRPRLPRAELPVHGSDETPALARIPDPAGADLETMWDEEWQKNLMDAAIHRVKRKVPMEQYQMFDFYVLKQMPVREVTKALRVSVGQVYVAKHRISRLIKQERERLEQTNL